MNNLNSLYPEYCLPSLVKICPVVLKKKLKCEKFTDGQADNRQPEKLTWAFSSGELKTARLSWVSITTSGVNDAFLFLAIFSLLCSNLAFSKAKLLSKAIKKWLIYIQFSYTCTGLLFSTIAENVSYMYIL